MKTSGDSLLALLLSLASSFRLGDFFLVLKFVIDLGTFQFVLNMRCSVTKGAKMHGEALWLVGVAAGVTPLPGGAAPPSFHHFTSRLYRTRLRE